MPKLLLSTNASALAEPIHSLSVEVSTQTSADVKSAPTGEPPSVQLRRIINQLEDERWTLVLESRKWDEAREWEDEFYSDGYQHD
jgi:hypothetical protein